ncbi:hypothetical protein F2Q65_02305 [Thiohalocapsa marina]|uniref:Single Cache domain-containing protein n=1 Tax=Thiohalocapsa marina TaxID=424902 RepID=A0A5M8FUA2_9GAMM|nr:cache domain-containing protein [Thiohalocapsa marina]KAA6187376.1 hypothetical protein F2Q65_02305 [Thiohalocapsa marina]
MNKPLGSAHPVQSGLICCTLVAFTLLWPTTATRADEMPDYEHQSIRAIVELVNAAAAAIETQGEAVFPDFRIEGSRWFQGDRYLFVWDLEGNRQVYPPDLEHERQNLLDLQDIGGKPIGRMFVRTARDGDGQGWVHYQWNRPHDPQPVWKSTYITRATAPDGTTYLVGSGLYQPPMEKAFLVQEVRAAASLLEKQGRAAFERLRDKRDRFFFHDTYVFVTSDSGIELVNPAFPAIEGRNLWDARDMDGTYIVRNYITLAREQGSGWVHYLWPRPGMPERPARKTTYVQQVMVDGEPMIVGAGMYE